MGKRIKSRRILNHLPAEIIDEILYKLPVKSLLRFKCVSKSWRCSISSRGFIKKHLNITNSGTDFTHHNLIFTFEQNHENWGRWDSIGSCCIGSLLNDDDDYDYDDEEATRSLGCNLSVSIPALEYNNPMNPNNLVSFLGSCNGLILVSINREELYLWNPSTRKAKNIINDSIRQETTTWQITRHSLIYGFGYNESMEEYKVVCNFYYSPHQEEQMFMYSSRSGSWTKIQNFVEGFLFIANDDANFVNGRLYWLANKDIESRYIVCLDLVVEDEKYQILPLPDRISDYPFSPFLEDFGGYLSLICSDDSWCTMDVWVMEKESWSKILTFSNQTDHVPRLIWLKKNGDIVVALGSDLVIFRGNDKLRQSPVDMLNGKSRRVYVESLVSPFGDNDDDQ